MKKIKPGLKAFLQGAHGVKFPDALERLADEQNARVEEAFLRANPDDYLRRCGYVVESPGPNQHWVYSPSDDHTWCFSDAQIAAAVREHGTPVVGFSPESPWKTGLRSCGVRLPWELPENEKPQPKKKRRGWLW